MSLWSLVIACPVAAAMLGLALMRWRFLVVTVTGTSMTPALMPGDRVLVRRRARDGVRVGRIVVFGDPGSECLAWGYDPDARKRWMIKRVAAMHGDLVPEVAQPAVGDITVVPPGMLVVLGDNPASSDSRTWGLLPAGDVLGIAVRRLPPSGTRRQDM
jgi:signal peptidase I